MGKHKQTALRHTKENSTDMVLRALLSAQKATKAQLAAKTGLSVMSVGRIASDLLDMGLLSEEDPTELSGRVPGPTPAVLSFRTDHLLCCSIFLDTHMLCMGIIDPHGQIRQQVAISVPDGSKYVPEAILPWLAEHVSTFVLPWQGHGLLSNIGVVVPGIVDVEKGHLQFSAALQWQDYPLAAQLKALLPDFDFYLENDIKALACAEYQFGALRGLSNAVVLSLGDGVGSAAILNGEIYRGTNGMAGEIGHIPLNPAGKICECGQVGCLQTTLARTSLLNEAQSIYPGISLAQLLHRAEGKEPFASALMKQIIDSAVVAIHLLAYTYNPEVICLTGSSLWECPVLRDRITLACQRKFGSPMEPFLQLRSDTFGADGYLIGGGTIAFHRALQLRSFRHI